MANKKEIKEEEEVVTEAEVKAVDAYGQELPAGYLPGTYYFSNKKNQHYE